MCTFLSRRFLVKSFFWPRTNVEFILPWALFFNQKIESGGSHLMDLPIWKILAFILRTSKYFFLSLLCCNRCYCHFLFQFYSSFYHDLSFILFDIYIEALLQLGLCLGQVWYPVLLTFVHVYVASSAKLQLWCYIIGADLTSPFVSYGYILPYEVLEVYWCTFDVGCCCSLSEGVLFFPWEKWQEWWIN